MRVTPCGPRLKQPQAIAAQQLLRDAAGGSHRTTSDTTGTVSASSRSSESWALGSRISPGARSEGPTTPAPHQHGRRDGEVASSPGVEQSPLQQHQCVAAASPTQASLMSTGMRLRAWAPQPQPAAPWNRWLESTCLLLGEELPVMVLFIICMRVAAHGITHGPDC